MSDAHSADFDAPVEKRCDYYDAPGQDCFTAGMAVIAAEGLCGRCAVRLIEGRVTPPAVLGSAEWAAKESWHEPAPDEGNTDE